MSRFLLRRKSRHLPPWLTFDVRQKNTMCTTCEYPARRLWSFHSHPRFVKVRSEGWGVIESCPECGQLWCEVMHEPHSAFSFWAAWPGSQEEWAAVLKIEEGLPYYEWHDAVLTEDYPKLPPNEKDAVDAWRRRAYGLTPIDSRSPRYCRSSEDIRQFIK
jgi:hypothetical protein